MNVESQAKTMVLTPFQQLVRSRRSIRKYLGKPVEREKILSCIEAARLAPSASNVQPWRFLIIDDPALKASFAERVFSGIYSPTRFAAKAPVLILLLARLDFVANRLGRRVQGVSFYLIDSGIAGEHFVLQAEEFGLGTCWIGWFSLKKARHFFYIPRKYKIVAMLAMGYHDLKPQGEKPRKKLEEIAWFNRVEG
jgi:nitroreductase